MAASFWLTLVDFRWVGSLWLTLVDLLEEASTVSETFSGSPSTESLFASSEPFAESWPVPVKAYPALSFVSYALSKVGSSGARRVSDPILPNLEEEINHLQAPVEGEVRSSFPARGKSCAEGFSAPEACTESPEGVALPGGEVCSSSPAKDASAKRIGGASSPDAKVCALFSEPLLSWWWPLCSIGDASGAFRPAFREQIH